MAFAPNLADVAGPAAGLLAADRRGPSATTPGAPIMLAVVLIGFLIHSTGLVVAVHNR